ncbi:MAG: hypothetical protein DCC57_24895, partial [Chloroflexi bacterium]
PQFAAIGGHPMCGKETAGLAAAVADLYRDQTFILCPTLRATTDLAADVLAIIAAVGAHPAWMGAAVRSTAQRATVPALVGGGVLIGLCTVPCSGAVYLGVLSLLALQPSALLGYGYLVLYNVVFVLPLVVILAVATARPTLRYLAHWNLHHKEWVRLALGGGVVAMGLTILATV